MSASIVTSLNTRTRAYILVVSFGHGRRVGVKKYSSLLLWKLQEIVVVILILVSQFSLLMHSGRCA
jgi:hypothetical protein